jgi:hypothetical protein
VKLNLPPGAIDPESNTAPESVDVDVWAIVSLFVHVICVPDATVIGFGTYELVPSDRAPTGIDTAAVGTTTGAGVVVVEGEFPLQPETKTMRAIPATS